MWKNYLKIAGKVLMRRKFFTFVSLFGISFTLLILMVCAAFVVHMAAPAKAGSKFDRSMIIERIELKSNDVHIFSNPSYYFLDRYVRSMKQPEAISLQSTRGEVSVYVSDRKVGLGLKSTDEVFWDIMEFPFPEGRPYDAEMVSAAEPVAVITDWARKQVFGSGPAIGEYLETTAGKYRVIGVIPKKEITTALTSSDIYVPITTSGWDMSNRELYSYCLALVLARDKSDFQSIRSEFDQRRLQALQDYSGKYNEITCQIGTQADLYIAGIAGGAVAGEEWLAFAGMLVLAVLFMLFPAINLVNINLSRIIERSSEIGIRKAFGASSRTLLAQFVAENVFLTLLGGALAFLMTWVVLAIMNSSGMIPIGHLELNWSVFLTSMFLSLLFGLLSGALPAYRMSRLHPVDALRGGAA
jgi:putative ABC transport system permease protein